MLPIVNKEAVLKQISTEQTVNPFVLCEHCLDHFSCINMEFNFIARQRQTNNVLLKWTSFLAC